jgi:hypothetical protein
MYGLELTKATIADLTTLRDRLRAVLFAGVGIAQGGHENLYAVIGGLSGRIATLEASLA